MNSYPLSIANATGVPATLLVDWLGTHIHILVPRRASVLPGDRVRPRIDVTRALLFDTAEQPKERP